MIGENESMKSFENRKGITLLEVLVTVSVLVLLCTGFFLAGSATSSSADGTRIITDLMNIKKAAILWYSDNYDTVKTMRANNTNIQANTDALNGICKYISGGSNITLNQKDMKEGTYGIYNVKARRTIWYVGYRFAKDENNIRKSIEGQADLLGLHFSDVLPDPTKSNGYDPSKDSGEKKIVWMHILGD